VVAVVEEEVEGADLAEAVLVEMECGDREASAVLLLLSDVQGNYLKTIPGAPQDLPPPDPDVVYISAVPKCGQTQGRAFRPRNDPLLRRKQKCHLHVSESINNDNH